MTSPSKYRLRNNMVMLRKRKVIINDLAFPDQSTEGTEFIVEGVGPEVTDLTPGMSVMMMGRLSQDPPVWPVPGEKDLLIMEASLVKYEVLPPSQEQ